MRTMVKPWAQGPPKMRPPESVEPEPDVTPDLPSTSLSSQDGAEPVSPPQPDSSLEDMALP